jgi:hypothetical protein
VLEWVFRASGSILNTFRACDLYFASLMFAVFLEVLGFCLKLGFLPEVAYKLKPRPKPVEMTEPEATKLVFGPVRPYIAGPSHKSAGPNLGCRGGGGASRHPDSANSPERSRCFVELEAPRACVHLVVDRVSSFRDGSGGSQIREAAERHRSEIKHPRSEHLPNIRRNCDFRGGPLGLSLDSPPSGLTPHGPPRTRPN